MSLAPGTRIGAYEIVSALGAGGMGEVYRARDTRLGREVAIKVIAQSAALDPERAARFAREAQLLASLNHPHIATLYGVEQTGDAQFLVMELVEGETLAARIASGPLPIDEALRLAGQVADALQAAHDKGIVHRDLKPANIALTVDGQVKVLDFGLAKAMGAEEGHDDAGGRTAGLQGGLSMSPTLTSPALVTGIGVLLGTGAYMAPEQAKGRVADKRSDIWAFGCVLYEMLAGRRAFDGDDITEVIGAVTRLEPNWSVLPAGLPLAVSVLLRRCLEKDARRRPGDAAALRFVLAEAAALGLPVTATQRPRVRTRARLAASAAMLMAAAAGAGAAWTLRAPVPLATVRTSIVTRATTASFSGAGCDLAITPDGSRIVYRADNEILVRPLNQLEPSALPVESPRCLFASPDGEWVGFFSTNRSLHKVALGGGPSVAITATDGTAIRGATWGADDTIVYATYSPQAGLYRVGAAGGEPTVLTKPDAQRGESDHFWPEFLPDGRHVLFTVMPVAGGETSAQIAAVDVQTGSVKVLLRGGTHARYAASGHLLFGAGGALRAVPFDLGRLEVTGPAVPVIDRLLVTTDGAVQLALAANGSAVYVPGGTDLVGSRLTWVDRQGREEPLAAPVGRYAIPRVSPDGNRVAVDLTDERDQDIWVWERRRGTFDRLTSSGPDTDPVWSPDGRWLAFRGGGATGRLGLHRRAADGTGPIEQITSGAHAPVSWTPDGTRVVFVDLATMDLSIAWPGPQPRTEPLLTTPAREDVARVSPDGRWLAYETNETGTGEVFVRPFPDVAAARWRVSPDGGLDPVWSRDGRRLFYRRGQAIVEVAVTGGDPGGWSRPQLLFEGPYVFNPGPTMFDVAPDGRFLMLKPQGDRGEASPLVLIQHWHDELKRLVPER